MTDRRTTIRRSLIVVFPLQVGADLGLLHPHGLQPWLDKEGRLVVSNDLFNQKTGLAIVCPITNTHRGIPFHVALPEETSVTGFVMVEQVKSIDFGARKVKLIEKAPTSTLSKVLGILDACLY